MGGIEDPTVNICPEGFYCPEGTNVPLPCKTGYYCTGTGLSEATG